MLLTLHLRSECQVKDYGKAPHLTRGRLLAEFTAVGIGATPRDKGENTSGVTIEIAITQAKQKYFTAFFVPNRYLS
jgi:hypothetical protein